MISKIRMMAFTEQLPWASTLPHLTAALSGIIHSVQTRNCSSERLCHLPEVTQLESVGLSGSGAPRSPWRYVWGGIWMCQVGVQQSHSWSATADVLGLVQLECSVLGLVGQRQFCGPSASDVRRDGAVGYS